MYLLHTYVMENGIVQMAQMKQSNINVAKIENAEICFTVALLKSVSTLMMYVIMFWTVHYMMMSLFVI